MTSKKSALLCAVAILPCWVTVTLAQEDILLEPIIITGQKVERSLKDTASSVSVLTDLDGAPTVADALRGTPNVLYTSNTDAPIIRGIDTKGPVVGGNAYLAKPIPRATISVDGRYLDSAEFGFGAASMWDVESVEVFRGPQTTTQGANSVAGAVVVNTKDPTFAPEAEGQLVYGERGRRRASFAASGQIATDLAARLSFDYNARDSFVDFTNPAFTEKGDLGFRDMTTRLKFLWQPVELAGFEAKLTFARTKANRPSGEQATEPFEDLRNGTLYVDHAETESDGVILNVSQDFGGDLILRNVLQLSTGEYHVFFAPPYQGIASRDYDNLSNELRLNFGTEESIFSGVAGIFYARDKAHNVLNNTFGSTDARLGTESLGIFSELQWRFADRWSVTGGLRYQQDRITHDGVASYVPGVRHDYAETFSDVLPSLSLAYDLADETVLGASVSKGYIPGGTGVNFSGGAYYDFDAETVWNCELFARHTSADGRLMLSGNLFYTDYRDAQRSVTDYLDGRPFGSVIINSDKAETYGLEVAADYQARDDLRLRGGIGLLHTEISKFADYRGNSFEGNEFGKAPGHMLNLGWDWTIRPEWTLAGDVRFVGDYFSADTNEPEYRVDSYAVANLRLTYSPAEAYELFVYANNVFDDRIPLSKSYDRTAGAVSASMFEPREVGIGVKAKF